MNHLDETAGASAPPRHALLPVNVPGAAVTAAAGKDAHLQLLGELQSNHPLLLHWMRHQLGDHKLAADLLNHTVLTALEDQRSGRLHCGGDLAGHVFRIGMNLLRKQHCKLENRPHLPLASDAAPLVSKQAAAQTGHDEQLKQVVRQLLESLSSRRERQIVTQFYLDGADKKSLCRQFAVSNLQFNGIVSRVRRRMQVMLDAGGLR
jgi:DNA-directed RNA polymerase specialized sigma24 family protein